MAAWNSRGLRGSTFEELINQTNEQYEQMNLALIQKIPTPITPVKIDQGSRHITLEWSIFFYHYKTRVFLHNKKVLKSKRNQYLLRYSNKDAA